MKKYFITKIENIDFSYIGITISDNESAINFPAEIGNPNYDQFLIDADLTDKKVQALTPDKWYDFPKES